MKKIEYCIVGGGYAGIFLAHQCVLRGKSFVLFDEGLESSASKISAGMVNPVVLKKFTTFWKAQEQINVLSQTMEEMSQYLGENFFIKSPIHRIFHDENEQKLWDKKRQNEDLKPFLEEEKVFFSQIKNEYGCGRVLNSGYIKVSLFFEKYYQFLEKKGFLVKQKFDYNQYDIHGRIYENNIFENIIFCEGIAVKNNPFFYDIPISPNKGHQLEVSFPNDFVLNQVVKKKHFLIPISRQKYYYGGTYDREDIETNISSKAIEQLIKGLDLIVKEPYFIEKKNMAFRPTVSDRRPIIGKHSLIDNMYIFNGLGARGLLNGAYFSPILMDFIEGKCKLPEEVSLERFRNKE